MQIWLVAFCLPPHCGIEKGVLTYHILQLSWISLGVPPQKSARIAFLTFQHLEEAE